MDRLCHLLELRLALGKVAIYISRISMTASEAIKSHKGSAPRLSALYPSAVSPDRRLLTPFPRLDLPKIRFQTVQVSLVHGTQDWRESHTVDLFRFGFLVSQAAKDLEVWDMGKTRLQNDRSVVRDADGLGHCAILDFQSPDVG